MIRRDFITPLGSAAFLGVAACCCFTSSVQAINCLSALDQSDSGWWSWREIDGRKCWYKKVGAVPPKSTFMWPAHAKETLLAEASAQPGSSSAQAIEAMSATSPRIEIARTKPVDPMATNFRLNDRRVGLIEGFYLSDSGGIGSTWEVPNYVDTFEARYGQW
jgi:hypothetical protein